jgi:hypothetical protein
MTSDDSQRLLYAHRLTRQGAVEGQSEKPNRRRRLEVMNRAAATKECSPKSGRIAQKPLSVTFSLDKPDATARHPGAPGLATCELCTGKHAGLVLLRHSAPLRELAASGLLCGK